MSISTESLTKSWITGGKVKQFAKDNNLKPSELIAQLREDVQPNRHIHTHGYLLRSKELPTQKEALLDYMGIKPNMTEAEITNAFDRFLKRQSLLEIGIYPAHFKKFLSGKPKEKQEQLKEVLNKLYTGNDIRENQKPLADELITFINDNSCMERHTSRPYTGYIQDLSIPSTPGHYGYLSKRMQEARQAALFNIQEAICKASHQKEEGGNWLYSKFTPELLKLNQNRTP